MFKSLSLLGFGLVLGFLVCVYLLASAHQNGRGNPTQAWNKANEVVKLLLSGELNSSSTSASATDSLPLTSRQNTAPLIPLDSAAIDEIEGIHLKDSPLSKTGGKPPPAADVAIFAELDRLEQAERSARSAEGNRPDGD